ncbi:MAG: transketolase [Actinomycetota bacterium]|nr:transketolase [Actinomycetota bacterium]
MVNLTKLQLMELHEKSYQARINILKMMRFGEGHIGGAFSSLDIMTVLYNQILRHKPSNPKWEDRDRFILSAGHKCLALYACLADQGYFDTDVLWTYNTLDTRVPMHPDEKVLPGVEFPTGSLGHGLPVANGMALAGRLDKKDYRVFVILGDGECAEGSVWEAVMAAGHHHLDNVVAIVDRNRLQVNGRTEDIMDTSPFEDKFKAFGWEVKTINGHDFQSIYQVLSQVPFCKGKPSAIIADTVKCRGLDFGEDKFEFHHWHCELDKIDEAIDVVAKRKREEQAKIG